MGNTWLGNDTKRMRNCNGLDVGVNVSRCLRVFDSWMGKLGTSLGAHRVLFLDQHHFCDRLTGILDTVLFWLLFFIFPGRYGCVTKMEEIPPFPYS